ncbi:MAG: hypothetical protein LIR50_06865 [Bacillota bacterium]|nr:hypothetical protein [Bacillota bacterium]
MIIKEDYMIREDGVKLIRFYSDKNVLIENIETGEKYEDVIDPDGIGRTYKETEIKIEIPEESTETPPPFIMEDNL